MKSVKDGHAKDAKPEDKINLGTKQRILAILTGVVDEDPVKNIPLNYDFNFLCSTIKVPNPDKREFVYALNKLGYKAVQTYYNADNWKIEAPPRVIYDVLKAYKEMKFEGNKEKMLANLSKTSPGYKIMQKESSLADQISFDFKDEKGEGKMVGQKRKQKKYYSNPEPNWGPKARAG